MNTALIILAIQTIFGAIDNILHHELTERLPARASARRELALHSEREAIYGALFLVFAWTQPTGIFALAAIALLVIELVITIADFIEEDRSRHLPPLERLLHTILAVLYGAFLAFAVPWLLQNTMSVSALTPVSHGLLSWFFTLAAFGVFAFAARNAVAVRNLAKRAQANAAPVAASGRSVLITGGTGFIGAALVEKLLTRGDRVFVLSRDPRQARALFGARATYVGALSQLPGETCIDAVVNLAGAPIIGLPWFAARRREIWRSRVDLTAAVVAWLSTLEHKPRVLVSGSAIGYFGDRGEEILSESSPAGAGFGADLCSAWENEAMRAADLGIRAVCLRIALVLDRTGGPLPMMALPVRLCVGAIFGAGTQWMSWIPRDDLLRMIVEAIDDERWQGAVNAVAPEPSRHADFQRALARTLRCPMFFKIPAAILRTVLGEMGTVFLNSQRVIPAKAAALGFQFDVRWAVDALTVQLGPAPAALPPPQQTDTPSPNPAAKPQVAIDDEPAVLSRPIAEREGRRRAG